MRSSARIPMATISNGSIAQADQLNSEVEDVLEYQASDDSASMEQDEGYGPA